MWGGWRRPDALIHLYHGPDLFSLQLALEQLRAAVLADDSMAAFNETRLDGRGLKLGELQAATEALPFMGEHRLVLVRGLAARGEGQAAEKGANKSLTEGLTLLWGRLPPSTVLVHVEGNLSPANPLLKALTAWRAAQPQAAQAAEIRAFEAPKAAELPAWLRRRAADHGGAMEPAAAVALADALTRDRSVDLGTADQELLKLITWADGRPVTAADVAQLVTSINLESIFVFVDALAERNGRQAIGILHKYQVQGEPPLRILALVVRQFRMLLLLHALQAEGVPGGEIRSALGVAPFLVPKLQGQARRFNTRFLEAAMRRLRDIDTQVKTGKIDAGLALDLFVAGVCGVATRR